MFFRGPAFLKNLKLQAFFFLKLFCFVQCSISFLLYFWACFSPVSLSHLKSKTKLWLCILFTVIFFFLTYEFDLWVANSAWLAVFQAVEKQMPLTFPNYESLCCVLSSVAVYRLTCYPPPAQVGGVTEGWVLAGGRRGWSLWFWVALQGWDTDSLPTKLQPLH